MQLHLDILPRAQRELWPMLSDIPKEFVLYGGTAIALQLGHRESIDFDFFSQTNLDKNKLLRDFPILNKNTLMQPEINTINSFIKMADGTVKLQFLAGLGERQKIINTPLVADDNHLKIASLQDLFGTKLNTIQQRAECKDYIDIDALIQSGISLTEGLSLAKQIYGNVFDPSTSLRALCSYRDGDLNELDEVIKERLMKAAKKIDNIP